MMFTVQAEGVGVGLGGNVAVAVAVAVAVGVGVGVPDCAQYLPPVFTDRVTPKTETELPVSFCPPQTTISLTVHTTV
jgi:hypothetical protein